MCSTLSSDSPCARHGRSRQRDDRSDIGYKGPIGILDHRDELDAEQSLRENLEGLAKLIATFPADE